VRIRHAAATPCSTSPQRCPTFTSRGAPPHTPLFYACCLRRILRTRARQARAS
jgi:hypothetical protein